ncbi:TlpA disulfide reductase family protein [Streptomyces sp. JJ36]|uniref:TlpA family protein disulfide reductase n=1 Tax=Streptomyces sp. JJ36 TaxID=2736645 RepID=UPI001F46074F|nr:TlpA disulfide reductase family protein [Streptomyces sp. JJ36]MCF6524715.1 TlpA family protein disulfide reductase [Streptomyces sp. JJ36]
MSFREASTRGASAASARPAGRFRRPVRVSAATACAAVAALVLAGCGGPEVQSSGDNGFVQGTGQVTTVSAKARKPAPDISGKTVDGKRISLSDYRGKIVVVNVWGSWCAPCRAEAPHLAKVAEETADEGVAFVGINTRDLDRANARAFERTYDIDYPSFYDPHGRLLLKFPKNTLSPQTIPSTVVLDREGRIAVRALKELDDKELRSMLDPLIAEK